MLLLVQQSCSKKASLDNFMDSILDNLIIFYNIHKEKFKSIQKVKLIFLYYSIKIMI